MPWLNGRIEPTVTGGGLPGLNVIGNWRMSGGPHEPDYRRIAVLSLTHASLGNGLGIGLADFTTQRFMDEYDPERTPAFVGRVAGCGQSFSSTTIS